MISTADDSLLATTRARLSGYLRTDRVILCRTDRDARPAVRIEPHPENEASEKSGRAIVCARCQHPITSEEQRIRVNGSHDHRCVNPYGLVFHIGCFREAPGCLTSGVPTTEFTWFSGLAWNFAQCGGCGELLGWRYHGSGLSFVGLILNRLATEGHRDNGT